MLFRSVPVFLLSSHSPHNLDYNQNMFTKEQQLIESKIKEFCAANDILLAELKWQPIPFSGEWGFATSFFQTAANEARAGKGNKLPMPQKAQRIAEKIKAQIGKVEEISQDDLIIAMVGREITQMFPKLEVPIGEVVLSVKNLCLDGVFSNISFDVRAGEIVGMAGLVGSGRSNVAEALCGVTPATSGSITINGRQVAMHSPAVALAEGMAFLTEDRKETGCFLGLNIQENMDSAVLNQRYV